jgi:hypothetical protein
MSFQNKIIGTMYNGINLLNNIQLITLCEVNSRKCGPEVRSLRITGQGFLLISTFYFIIISSIDNNWTCLYRWGKWFQSLHTCIHIHVHVYYIVYLLLSFLLKFNFTVWYLYCLVFYVFRPFGIKFWLIYSNCIKSIIFLFYTEHHRFKSN